MSAPSPGEPGRRPLHPRHGVHAPTESTPPRRPASLRRTATTDMLRPDGLLGDLVLVGRARDLWTDAHGAARVALPVERGACSLLYLLLDDLPLARVDDPLAWHALPPIPPNGMRRHRRLDLTLAEKPSLDVLLRDSHVDPDGRETIVHEYSVAASVDPGTWS